MPNPGIQVGHVYEKRLKILCYFVNHLRRIQRAMDVNAHDLATLTSVYLLQEQDEDDDYVALPTPLTRVENAREGLENICPLAYIVRLLLGLPAAADDPGFGNPSFHEEMIARAPHTGPNYHLNNRAVWDLIRHVCHGGPAWEWVSMFACAFDGRSAYLSLKTHYLGETFQALVLAQADKKLDKTFYDGTSKKFAFESYISASQHAFSDREACGDPISEA
jgi:hypothetical protein